MLASPTAVTAQTPCPQGLTISLSPADSGSSTFVRASLSSLVNVKPASENDATAFHMHYFVDVPATAAGAMVPMSDPRVIHSGSLTQDLGTLSAGPHTVTAVLGQFSHAACEARGSATFSVGQTPSGPTAPNSGNAGLAGSGATALTVVLLIGVAVAVVVAARLWTTRGGGGGPG
jgi:hypothetical protein